MTKEALLLAAEHFSASDCCSGKKLKITAEDLQALGLWPIPATFQASIGTIMPSSGYRALGVFIHGSLSKEPFPPDKLNDTADVAKVVADLLRKLACDTT